MQPTAPLPDNLKSRVSRIFVASREFTDDAGKTVAYNRLVIEVMINGEPMDLEIKADKKDLAILRVADQVDKPDLVTAS